MNFFIETIKKKRIFSEALTIGVSTLCKCSYRSVAFLKTDPEFSHNLLGFTQECKFGVDDKCFLSWNQQGGTWSIVNSFDFPMGPVFDSRWDYFEDLEATKFSKIDRQRSDLGFGATGSVTFSIRGSYPFKMLICESENFLNDFCYQIVIDYLSTRMSEIGKWTNGIPEDRERPRTTKFPLKSKRRHRDKITYKEWKTFVLTWKEKTRTIELFDPDKKILSYSDLNSINRTSDKMYPVFYKGPNNYMLIRFHDYFYTLTKDRGAVLKRSLLILTNSQKLCIDMLVGLCKHCELIVNIIDGSGKRQVTKTIRRSTEYDSIEHDLPMWQHARIEDENISDYPTPITFELVTSVSSAENDKTKDHWAITKFEQCLPKGTVKLVKMFAHKNYTTHDDFLFFTTCQRLSYDDPKSETLEAFNKLFTNLNHFKNCPNYNFGLNCQIKCNWFSMNNCYSVKVCFETSCSCVQGWQGTNCSTKCPPGNVVGCSKKCSDCIGDICDSSTEKCYLGCKEFHQCETIKLSPMLYIDDLKDTSARVYFYAKEMDEIADATFGFEIETESGTFIQQTDAEKSVITNNGTEKNIYSAIFNALSSGGKYSVKLIVYIQLVENPNITIKGEPVTFTTLCNWSQQFKIIPGENSLMVEKISEKELSHCPNSWESMNLPIISLTKNKSYSVNTKNIKMKFPITLSELHPFTEYEVCINGRDQKFKICQLSSTLESAPSPVINLQIISVTTTEAQITWSSPDLPNGIIKGYNLTIEVLYYLGCENAENTTEDLRIIKVYPNIAPTTEVLYKLINLVPYVSYQVTVIAFNSKVGNENSLIFNTKPTDIPAEVFSEITFLSDGMTWDNPAECWTITGPIVSSRVIIIGVSESVRDFYNSYDTEERFINLDTLLNGNEMYYVRIHVLHELGGLVNATAYIDTYFLSNNQNSSPKVQNLQIVEVDESTTTLRWQRPSSLTNKIDYYYIHFLLSNGTFLDKVKVYSNETCYLWKNSFCKTVFHPPFTKNQYIVVSAQIEEIVEPVEVFMINDDRQEQVPRQAKIISITEIEKGVVHLKWQHPTITGGPITKFIISPQIFHTKLEGFKKENSVHGNVIFPIHKYQLEYSTYLYLLPSTHYGIFIQARTSLQPGKISTKTIVTKNSLNFQYKPRPVLDNSMLLINIVIPPVINNTKDSQLSIIVKGPWICKQGGRLSSSLMKDIKIDDQELAWRVVTFRTHETANLSFTIGDDHIYDTVSNCPLKADNSYVIILLVRENINQDINEISQPLIWESYPIMVGETAWVHHELWIIPLILAFLIIGGTTYYCLRTRRFSNGKQDDKIIRPIPIRSITPLKKEHKISRYVCEQNNTSNINGVQKFRNDTIAADDTYEEISDVPILNPKPSSHSTLHVNKIIATEPAYLEIVG